MNSGKVSERWFGGRVINSHASFRLFCFPFAGGGASAFRLWKDKLPSMVEVCPIQLPGRENRIMEPAFKDHRELVPALAEALQGYFDKPFVFLGHSMGAVLAYELIGLLRERKLPVPFHLFVSGRPAPHVPGSNPLFDLSEPDFIQGLRDYNGTPEAVLQNEELMELLLPVLRADFTLIDTYKHSTGEPVDCSITGFGGKEDPDTLDGKLEAWGDYTSQSFDFEFFPGGHFFIQDCQDLFLKSLSRKLSLLLN